MYTKEPSGRAAFDFVKLKNISRAADTRIPLLPADQAGTLLLKL